MTELNKKRVFSGAQPTGNIHIGNYIGALSLWVENQDIYDNIFCVVDLHALTIPEAINPERLKQQVREVAALYLACGIDPKKSTIFVQSHVPAHAELAWLLNCVTPFGWLERMTQFKDKSAKQKTVGTGLFDYPVLMAADILLYDADFVPVGEDQKQHVEITRDIAQRFNSLFGDTFVVPQELIRKSGARIMGFDNPEVKMSKSIAQTKQGHAISLLDDSSVIKKTISRAITDEFNETHYDLASPGVKNLLTLYQIFTGKSLQDIDNHFEGKGYGFLKKETTEAVILGLEPIQKKYNEIMSDQSYLDGILSQGAERVSIIAETTLNRVKDKIGLTRR